jgi:serine/threonine protein kinase
MSTSDLPPQGTQAAVVEALLARSLSHPHIVTTFSHGMSAMEVGGAAAAAAAADVPLLRPLLRFLCWCWLPRQCCLACAVRSNRLWCLLCCGHDLPHHPSLLFLQVREMARRHSQVWIVQEFCNRGSLLDAIDKGSLHLADEGPNMQAILLSAQEIAGELARLSLGILPTV